MPAKNIVKTYIENGYYHIYNRGIEKREIFLDEQDCNVFLYYLKAYLSPKKELQEQSQLGMKFQRFIRLNLAEEIDLLSFALMPNHFHLLIKQSTRDGIKKLMQRVSTGYVMYFNKKYKRVGGLFQNTYKAAIIQTDPYLLHLSRYIHLNASKLQSLEINFTAYSSYPYYLGRKEASWIKPQEILSYFKSSQSANLKDISSYQSFVEDYPEDPAQILEELILEDTDEG